MAKLKRNMIKLVKNPEEAIKGAEIEFETFWTTPFLPASVTYEAMDLADQMDDEKNPKTARETVDLLGTFISEKVYGGQFKLEDLQNRFHGPDLIKELQDQIYFVAQGQQTDETKNFLAKKN